MGKQIVDVDHVALCSLVAVNTMGGNCSVRVPVYYGVHMEVIMHQNKAVVSSCYNSLHEQLYIRFMLCKSTLSEGTTNA